MRKLADWRSCVMRPLTEEEGTVTVDFVVLTAALATLGLVVFSVIETGLVEVSSDISNELTRTWN